MTMRVNLRSRHPCPPSTLDWIIAISKTETNTIGFIPRSGIKRHYDDGNVLVAFEDASPVGFLIHGPLTGREYVVINQLLVIKAKRRQGIGKRLVDDLQFLAYVGRSQTLRLSVGMDLQAVHFWKAIGFHETRVREGGARRRRLLVDMINEKSPGSKFAPEARKTVAQDRS